MGALSKRVLCSLRLSATPPGLPSRIRKKGCRGTAGTKADLRSMSCWASSLMRTSRLSICSLRGECICPFCSQIRPVVATTTLAPGMMCVQWNIALSYFVLAVLGIASSFINGSHEEGLLVLVKIQRAQQFGDGSPCWIFFYGQRRSEGSW